MKFFNNLKFQKQFLEYNKAYLKKGKYVLHGNMRTYLLKENWKNAKRYSFPEEKYGFVGWIKRCIAHFFYSVKISKNGEKFNGQAVYFSNLPDSFNRDAKIFDYDTKKICTICQNKKRYDLYIGNREYFEKYFNMPELLFRNDKRFIYEERLIEKHSIQGEFWKEIYHKLFGLYQQYFAAQDAEIKDDEYSLSSELTDLNISTYLKTVYYYKQHGDLSPDNFIYEKSGKIYFIDFDHANYYPLFYDVFFLMINLYVVEGNKVGVKLFLEGEFDKYFEQIPTESRNIKLVCFAWFVECFWKTRICSYVSLDKKKVYFELFENMINDLRG